jgi:putative membrane protein
MTRSGDEVALTTRDIFAIERPDSSLLSYYFISSLPTFVAFPIVFTLLYFRYHTMRYRFSDEGVSMRWGVLFRKEINLTFARIQDIHLTSNFVERWLGLARIQIQTASGSSGAEMTIEGVREYGALRDFLYGRMRGARGMGQTGSPSEPVSTSTPALPAVRAGQVMTDDAASVLAATLREAAGELRAIRESLRARGGPIDG